MTKIGLFWNYLSLLLVWHISEGRLFLVNSSGKKNNALRKKKKHCVLLLPPFSDSWELFYTGWAPYNIWNTSRFITYRALQRGNSIFDLETIATECCSYSLLAKAHQEYNQNRQKPIKNPPTPSNSHSALRHGTTPGKECHVPLFPPHSPPNFNLSNIIH